MNAYFSLWVKTIITLSVILLCGCSPKIVYVPVSSCPAPPVMVMPELAVSHLAGKPDTKDALKALMVDHVTLRGNLEQCLVVLEGYRK